MATPVLDRKKAYRRGLLLGFTMAEVTIMILFCLLLASSFMQEREREQIKEAEQRLADAREQVDRLKAEYRLVEEFKSKYARDPKSENIFTDLALVREKNIQLEKEAAEHTAELVVLRENLKMVESMKGALKSAGLSDLPISELTALVRAGVAKGEKAVQCERTALEKERLEGQVKSQQVMLARHGTEMPACWASKTTGKPDYIFNIDLTSTGLIVHDQKLPQWAAEQALLPLQGISFDVEVSPDLFRSQMNQLLNWSKEHGCRFFVTVRDLTQSTEKDAYKRMLKALEDRFYKLEIK